MKGATVSKQGLVPNALAYQLLGLEMPTHTLPRRAALGRRGRLRDENALVGNMGVRKQLFNQ